MLSESHGALLERAALPPRAKVRGLEPIGVGTGWVESTSSLLTRTATANRLPVRPFLERVLAEVADELSAGSATRTADLARVLVRSRSMAAINGSGSTARAWTALLAAATLIPDLEATTCIPWADRFSSRGALRDQRAFCPACLWDWARGDSPLGKQPVWEPLRWQFRALEICVTHEVRLAERCPTPGCGRTRAVVSGRASVERCVACRLALARPLDEVRASQPPPTRDELDWARFVDAELSDILARPPGPMPTPAPFAAFLEVALESVTAGAQREFARRIGMTEASVSYWKDGARAPTLAAILRVCRVAGFRLRDVLTGDLEAAKASPAPLEYLFVAPSTETHVALDHEEIERILEQALVADPAPSLASVYADVRVDRSHIRRRFPQRCARIRDRHQAWLDSQRAAVRDERSDRIRDEAQRLTAAGIYPSRNQMRKHLPGVWFRRPEFAAVWREAVIGCGWGDPSELRRAKGQPTPRPVASVLRRAQVSSAGAADASVHPATIEADLLG